MRIDTKHTEETKRRMSETKRKTLLLRKKEDVKEFLKQSNYIENERRLKAFIDARKAWQYARRYAEKSKINLEYVLKIHEILMKRIRPDIAGKLRNCDVFIGGERKKFTNIYILETDLEFILKNNFRITRFTRKWTDEKKEEEVKKAHIAFENIHPFIDGNGRVGRILLNIHRLGLRLPLMVIKENEKYDYYKWFTLENDFKKLIEFETIPI